MTYATLIGGDFAGEIGKNLFFWPHETRFQRRVAKFLDPT
jgi:hypothetical protein